MSVEARPEIPFHAGEAETFGAQLAYAQESLLVKIAGLDDEQLRQALVPSGVTLLGLLKHQAYVHRWWFRIVFAGEAVSVPWNEADPDADWRVEPDDTTDAIVALYRDEVARSRAILAGAALDAPAAHPKAGRSLRWIVAHMVYEVSRHCGHADILREQIDGHTGE